MEGSYIKFLNSLSQYYQGHSKQEIAEKLSLSGGAEGNLTTECKVVS